MSDAPCRDNNIKKNATPASGFLAKWSRVNTSGEKWRMCLQSCHPNCCPKAKHYPVRQQATRGDKAQGEKNMNLNMKKYI